MVVLGLDIKVTIEEDSKPKNWSCYTHIDISNISACFEPAEHGVRPIDFFVEVLLLNLIVLLR